MGSHMCYLPPDRGDSPAFTPAKAGTRFSDPKGMQGWVDPGGWLEMVYPLNGHPSWTNRDRCWLTSLMRPTTLTTTPSRKRYRKLCVDCWRVTYMCVAETALLLRRRRASTDPHEAKLVRVNEKHVLDIQITIIILPCRRNLLYDLLLITL